MKSTIAFALAATIPFAMASPYHMMQHAARDADANDVVIVTDVDVVAVTTQITVYYTGEPATPSTSAVATPTTAPVHQKQQQEHQHGRQSSVVYTIQKTTTPEAAPTVSSTAPPVEQPTTIITVVATPSPTPSPEPTTSSTSTSIEEAPVATSVAAAAVYSYPIAVSSPTAAADYASDPVLPNYGFPTTGEEALQGDNFRNAMTKTHDAWRAKWNAGTLEWDADLAATAASVASSCPTATDTTKPDSVHRGPGAQNMAWGSSIDTIWPIHLWGNEADQYGASVQTINLPSGPFTQYRMGTGGSGHFTQLVWKNATKLGCGTYNCAKPGADMGWWITVCNYDTGNGADPALENYWDEYGRNGSWAKNVNWAPVY